MMFWFHRLISSVIIAYFTYFQFRAFLNPPPLSGLKYTGLALLFFAPLEGVVVWILTRKAPSFSKKLVWTTFLICSFSGLINELLHLDRWIYGTTSVVGFLFFFLSFYFFKPFSLSVHPQSGH